MNKPLIVLGAGGHASVLLEELEKLGRQIEAIAAPCDSLLTEKQKRIKRLLSDEEVFDYTASDVRLVNAVAVQPGKEISKKIYERFADKGYIFETIVSVDATVSPSAVLSQGAQVLTGAIINAKAYIGTNTIINTGAVVEHDCTINKNNHIAPRATLCGAVCTEESVFIGAGAVVVQGVNIGARAVVGAGTTVAKDVSAGAVVLSAKNIIRQA